MILIQNEINDREQVVTIYDMEGRELLAKYVISKDIKECIVFNQDKEMVEMVRVKSDTLLELGNILFKAHQRNVVYIKK